MKTFLALFVSIILVSCQSPKTKQADLTPKNGNSIAVFAEGCFWCAEHIFEAIPGVGDVVSGYSGGRTENPTYEQVGAENTGHAESVLVNYDSTKISYNELLTVFFMSQDPTTPNQQGPDKGESYRSIAFYSNNIEKAQIEAKIKQVDSLKIFENKVVTEVLPLKKFYIAEDRHQNYVKLHPNDSYVLGVSMPRFNKFKAVYDGKLK